MYGLDARFVEYGGVCEELSGGEAVSPHFERGSCGVARRSGPDQKKIKDPKKIDRSLQLLMKLDKEGLLESFILLALPDDGIARDYAPTENQPRKSTCAAMLTQYVLTGGRHHRLNPLP